MLVRTETENSAVAKSAFRKLNLSWNDLSSVSAWAVSQAAGRLEEVALCYCRLTVSQLQEVLVVVSSGGQEHIKLARLDLQGNNISALSPRILSRAIIRLQADFCNNQGKLFSLSLLGIQIFGQRVRKIIFSCLCGSAKELTNHALVRGERGKRVKTVNDECK